MSGRQHRRRRSTREPSADPARSKNLCMYGISMRENREIPRLPSPLIGVGPLREGRGRTPGMYERGKSDRLVVPTKPPNKVMAAGGPPVRAVPTATIDIRERRDKPAWRKE